MTETDTATETKAWQSDGPVPKGRGSLEGLVKTTGGSSRALAPLGGGWVVGWAHLGFAAVHRLNPRIWGGLAE